MTLAFNRDFLDSIRPTTTVDLSDDPTMILQFAEVSATQYLSRSKKDRQKGHFQIPIVNCQLNGNP